MINQVESQEKMSQFFDDISVFENVNKAATKAFKFFSTVESKWDIPKIHSKVEFFDRANTSGRLTYRLNFQNARNPDIEIIYDLHIIFWDGKAEMKGKNRSRWFRRIPGTRDGITYFDEMRAKLTAERGY